MGVRASHRVFQKISHHSLLLLVAATFFICAAAARADSSFDLVGPRVDVRVMRANKTLPISNVPYLQAGDRLWVHPDFPDNESVHYLMIVAFLQGPTNPPPDKWFTKLESWDKKISQEGAFVYVPQGAQQALIFLAPDTGGGFTTLRSAVQGKPGAFVRASQDLNQAALDRTRLDKYLEEVRETSDADPAELKERSTLLARSLNVKVDSQCFDKPTEQQAPCLTQNSDQLVLDDGRAQSMVDALTSGPQSDLMNVITYTPLAGGGMYSPYVGAIVDVARIMSNLHSASYQYIPALAVPKKDELSLRLNNPPSFHKPKSVLVIGLPPVALTKPQPLRPVDRDAVFCLQQSPLILPVEGAPVDFSAGIAHDFVLRVPVKNGAALELPAELDPARGGFVVDTHSIGPNVKDLSGEASIHGHFGFDMFEGPRFHIRVAHSENWQVAAADRGALVIGREDVLHVTGDCAVCVQQVTSKDQHGSTIAITFKAVKPDELEIHVPLKDQPAGSVQILIKQFGVAKADELTLHSYSEAARLDDFTINAGDDEGTLDGTRLDEVEGLEIAGAHFVPAKLSRASQKDRLLVAADNSSAPPLQAGEDVKAHVELKDGRVLDLAAVVKHPRPKVTLLGRTPLAGDTSPLIQFGSVDDLLQAGKVSLLIRSMIPEKFSPTEKIEIATTDETFDATLSVADGSLVLQDSGTLIALFDPLKTFGPSAFGSLYFRAIDSDGDKSDWQSLGRLVRSPSLKELDCPKATNQPCRLIGSNLFLVDSISTDVQFTHPAAVPFGFMDSTLTVPRPTGPAIFIKLRDDPDIVNAALLPVVSDQKSSGSSDQNSKSNEN
jgi:hypothetical protein